MVEQVPEFAELDHVELNHVELNHAWHRESRTTGKLGAVALEAAHC